MEYNTPVRCEKLNIPLDFTGEIAIIHYKEKNTVVKEEKFYFNAGKLVATSVRTPVKDMAHSEKFGYANKCDGGGL